jgi:hypothetical protein
MPDFGSRKAVSSAQFKGRDDLCVQEDAVRIESRFCQKYRGVFAGKQGKVRRNHTANRDFEEDDVFRNNDK